MSSDKLKLQRGDWVKVSRSQESFWVKVRTVGPPHEGIVDNELVYTESHGFALGDSIKFNDCCIKEHIKGRLH